MDETLSPEELATAVSKMAQQLLEQAAEKLVAEFQSQGMTREQAYSQLAFWAGKKAER